MSVTYMLIAYFNGNDYEKYNIYRFDSLKDLLDTFEDIKKTGKYCKYSTYKSFSLR